MKRLVLAALIASGCVSSAPPPAAVKPAPPPPAAVEGPVWRLAAIDGDAIDQPVRMRFEGGKISGQGPCNALRGAYTRDGAAFNIGAILTTKSDCPWMALENRMIDGLLLAETAVIDAGRLRIASSDGPSLTFRPAGG